MTDWLQSAEALLRTLIGTKLGMDGNSLDPDTPFFLMGVNSMINQEIVLGLEASFGPLPPSLLFEYPNLSGLARYLAETYPDVFQRDAATEPQPTEPAEINPEPTREAEPTTAKPSPEPTPAPTVAVGTSTTEPPDHAVAVIGIKADLPGARDLDTFWRNLRDGVCSISTIPPNRWDVARYFDPDGADGKGYCRHGGFIEGFDRFDAAFFKMSPKEVALTDPQQRLFLETVWGLFEDAGINPREVPRDTAVLVGLNAADYGMFANQAALQGRGAYRNADYYQVANRVSYFFNLNGPSLALDSACSSAGTCLALACDMLRAGTCGTAVVGGVNLFLHPSRFVQYAGMRMLSPSGRCRPFSADADGTLFSEGVAAVLLKPLAQARADGDPIYGIIRGWALNSDGKTNGFTAPNPLAQADLVEEALKRAGVPPSAISYVEAHGTGTPLGDPIEIRGLDMAYTRAGSDRLPGTVALGSVKGNIGHLESAAALPGLIKVLLQMKHRTLVPSLFAETLNPKIPFDQVPFRVQQDCQPWPAPDESGATPRRAGLSAFGAGGSNTHFILEEHITPAGPPPAGPFVFPLSAADAPALERAIQSLAAYLGDHPTLDPAEVAFTLQTGRAPLAHRRCWIAHTLAELRDALAEPGTDNNVSNEFTTEIETLLEQRDLQTLAGQWCQGVNLDWRRLYATPPRRVSLPSYRFGGKRFPLLQPTSATAHPLLGKPAPNTGEQRIFHTTLSPTNAWLDDHRVGGRACVAGAVHLSACAAALQHLGYRRPFAVSHLQWHSPLFCDSGDRDIALILTPTENGWSFALEDDGGGRSVAGRLTTDWAQAAPSTAVPRLEDYPKILDAAAIQRHLNDIGLNYGPTFQGLQAVGLDDARALGRISVPAYQCADWSPCSPGILDAAFQVCVFLSQTEGRPFFPLSLEDAVFFAPPPPECYAQVRRLNDHQFAVTITDPAGQVCVAIRHYVGRPGRDPLATLFHVPRWERRQVKLRANPVAEQVLLVNLNPDAAGAARFCTALAATFPRDAVTTTEDAAHPSVQSADRIVCLALGAAGDLIPDNGELIGLPLFRALAARTRPVLLTLVTNRTEHLLGEDQVHPDGAALFALARSLHREQPRHRIQCFDINGEDPDPSLLTTLRDAEPTDAEPLYLRRGAAWQRALYPLEGGTPRPQPFSRGGVWLIAGGTGGLGFETSVFLAERAEARLAWIGRRAEDAAIRDQMERVRTRGGQVFYLQADLCDSESMSAAVAATVARFGPIEGAIFSALTLADAVLANQTPEQFTRAFRVKTLGTRVFCDVLQQQPLRHLLFYSSINARLAPPGQANYSAGCAYQDAYVRALPYFSDAVKRIINWGYWGDVGSVAGEENAARLSREGHQPLNRHTGMAALERVCSLPIQQVFVFGGRPPLTERLGVQNQPVQFTAAGDETLPPRQLRFGDGRLHAGIAPFIQAARALDQQTLARIAALPEIAALPDDPEAAARTLGVVPAYQKLFRALFPHIQAARQRAEQPHRSAPETLAEIAFLLPLRDACLADFVPVLTGRRDHRAVLFPGGSFDLVAPVYRDHPVTQAANQIVARAVADLVAEHPAGPFRILEVGAGTGATAAAVLPLLPQVALTYVFTDISPHFLHRAEQRFAGDYPFVRTQILNVEKAPSDQGFTAGAFDLVLATNVVHATAEVERALLHIKSLLKPGGAVLLNELTHTEFYHSLTFGLTSGWWAFRDGALRLPDSPLLDAAGWAGVLTRCGFADIHSRDLCDQGGGFAGHSLITGTSDGIVRGTAVSRPSNESPNQVTPRAPITQAPPAPVTRPKSAAGQGRRARCQSILIQTFAAAVDAQPGELDPETDFEAFGIDSLISLDVVDRLSQVFGELPTTLLFRNRSINEVTDWLLEHRGEAVDNHLREEDGSASAQAEAIEASALAQADTEQPRPLLLKVFAAALNCSETDLDPDADFEEFGIDSLISLEIVESLRADYGELPATLLFRHRTLNQLAAWFQTNRPTPSVAATDQPPLQSPAEPAGFKPHGRSAAERDPIAVIGLAGRYPLAADLEQFRDNLAQGRNCITRPPADRNLPAAAWGGFLDGVDQFDPLYFRIAPKDARTLDPQARLFLEIVLRTAESAAYPAGRLKRFQREAGPVGVFVGSMYLHYAQLARPESPAFAAASLNAFNAVANHVSHFFDLRGPSIAVDTACSASLTAVHLACDALQQGRCAMAFAGGVNLSLHAAKFAGLTELAFLGSGPRSRSLGQGDGMLPGEGVGAVLLKPLSRALADGDRIFGVIKASGVNHGGRTNGFHTPSGAGQSALIADVLTRAHINPETIDTVDLAANGSLLGDAVEFDALGDAFRRFTNKSGFCSVGSVKSNIGHLEAASGISQLTKMLLQLESERLWPTLHADPPNPDINWEDSPFRLQNQTTSWPEPADGRPRRGAVSSFGAGGSNAHLIVDGWRETRPTPSERVIADRILVLSARDSTDLETTVRRWCALLEKQPDLDLTRLCYTAQVGRDPQSARVAIIAENRDLLHGQLKAYLANPTPSAMRPAVPPTDAHQPRHDLAARWLAGEPIDWQALYPTPPRPLPIPGVVLHPRRCWFHPEELVHQPESAVTKPHPNPAQALPVIATNPDPRPVLIAALCRLLGFQPEDINERTPFAEMGMASQRISAFAADVGSQLGLSLRPIDVYNHPCLADLCVFLKTAPRQAAVRASEETAPPPVGATPPAVGATPPAVGTTPPAVGTTRALVLQGVIPTEQAQWQDHPIAEPAPDELSLAVHASGVNFQDLLCLQGLYPNMPAYPFVPGAEVAGTVTAVGASVTGFAVGDRVAAVTGAQLGGHADHVNVPARQSVPIPDHLAFATAAAVPVAFLTAHQALFQLGKLQAGETVLIQSAAGGVGATAAVLAKAAGARVIGTTGSPEKEPFLRQLGVDAVIPTQIPDFVDQVRAARAGRGVDLVVNSLGETMIQAGLDCLAPNGRYVELALTAWRAAHGLDLSRLVANQSLHVLDVRRLLDQNAPAVAPSFAALRAYLAAGAPDFPAVTTFPVSHAATALDRLAARKTTGKIVLIPRAQPATSQPKPTPPGRRTPQPCHDVAVIGIAARYPGSPDADSFIDNLIAGRAFIETVPAFKWSPDSLQKKGVDENGARCARWSANLANAEYFDHRFFSISPAEALLMDPQHRLLLEESWRAVENAGYAARELAKGRCGVFAGVVGGDYHHRIRDLSARRLTGNTHSLAAARIAYYLNLKGPCIAVDNACASSLVALDLACRALIDGECDTALAAGVHVSASADNHIMLAELGLLSARGVCGTFDAAADGVVLGEGVGALLLKRLDRARADGDTIRGVIKATGTNSNGTGNGLLALKPEAQAALQRRVYQRAGVDPHDLDYIEVQGPSTVLGDSLEVGALATHFHTGTAPALGCLKPNIGHGVAASGLAALTKVLLAMERNLIPPNIGVQTVNPALRETGFRFPTEATPWPTHAGRPKRAAVNNFGFNGTNCHVVVEAPS
ncbi:SDR family NAD(P)-dependent oxidoreductase [Acanthopleuribacter pedis]|uniref:SDR family NAD(P)-dependent oxidoreductase n=1 Tax=Acanthopleuribacter pedis TaxID=442870 RepID=A0A8J7QJI3_9BACT|nr:SDR family NAD(P)-dependent oxidoreductase [Acanthopleuribacter pedis]MBO1319360.1 SDR family NAD(P)-dependent oxidoreductase [Acanthopleuribacter pedis]